MNPGLGAVLGVFMRWIHILSAITLIGGFIFARYAVAPALAALPVSENTGISNRLIGSFRPVLYTAIVTALISGIYNYVTKPSYPPYYNFVIAIKFIFVLHVFATAVLYTIPNANEGNRLRRLNWLVISGIIIVLISADLRWMSLAPAAAH